MCTFQRDLVLPRPLGGGGEGALPPRQQTSPCPPLMGPGLGRFCPGTPESLRGQAGGAGSGGLEAEQETAEGSLTGGRARCRTQLGSWRMELAHRGAGAKGRRPRGRGRPGTCPWTLTTNLLYLNWLERGLQTSNPRSNGPRLSLSPRLWAPRVQVERPFLRPQHPVCAGSRLKGTRHAGWPHAAPGAPPKPCAAVKSDTEAQRVRSVQVFTASPLVNHQPVAASNTNSFDSHPVSPSLVSSFLELLSAPLA